MPKAKRVSGARLRFDCPGCGRPHVVGIEDHEVAWAFNGDFDAPTLSPSVLVRWTEAGEPRCCHSFVAEGYIKFLDDCTHALKGQHVLLPDLPAD
jgi:hypothetical protein